MALQNSEENALLAAVSIAAQDAASRIQAATITANAAADAEKFVATTNSTAQIQIANIESASRTTVASASGNFEVQVANVNKDAQTQVAQTEADARRSVASTEAAAQEQVASTNAQADISVAQAHANATTTAAITQANATTTAATTDAEARRDVAQTQYQAQVGAAQIDADARRSVASTEASASNYQADQQLAGVTLRETSETARLNTKLAFADDKWQTLLPVINEALGSAGSSSDSSGGGSIGFHASTKSSPIGFAPTVRASQSAIVADNEPEFQVGHYSRRVASPLSMGGGDVKTGGIGFATGSTVADAVAATQLPVISTSGVLTPSQVQQLVNSSNARADAKSASEFTRISQQLAGRGFSSNSPILAALQVGLIGQNLRTAISAESQIRIDSAKLNGESITTRQKNASDQFIQQEQVLLDSAKNDVTRTVGILSAVSQLIGAAL